MSLSELFTSGRAIDLVLVFMAAEFAVLCWRRRLPDRPGAITDLVFAMAPGACLMLALRVALTHGDWIWIATLVTASLPLHLVDLARRRV